LRAGSQDVSELLDRSLLIAQDAVEALVGMAGSIGHVSTSLVTASENYSNAERSIGARAAAIFGERG
jgi:hypothetical protein